MNAASSISSWPIAFGRLAVSLCLMAATMQGATYYVSPSGNDGGSGTTPATAWRSVAQVNGRTFSAGDSILFQRGGEWREWIVTNSPGAAGNPITYGAYGSGAKPRFFGSRVLPNAGFVLVGGSTYRITTSFPVDRHAGVAIDHALLPWTGFYPNASLQPDQYVIDDGTAGGGPASATSTIYINTNGANPVSDGRVYAATAITNTDQGVITCSHSHLVFQDLVTDESARLEAGFGWRMQYCDDVAVVRCEAWRVGVAHFGVVNSGDVTFTDCLASYAMANQTYIGNAAYFVNNGGSATVRFIDCVAQHLEDPGPPSGLGNYEVLHVDGGGTGEVVARNMTCRGNGGGNIGAGGTNRLTIQGGYIENARGTFYASNILMDGLTLTGSCLIDTWGSNCTYRNCSFLGTTAFPAAIQFRSGVTNSRIQFCTFIESPAAPSGAACIALANSSASQLVGNIMISTSRAFSGPSSALSLCDYNFYNANPTFTDSNIPFAAWRASFDQHSLSGDPLFTSATDDSLRAGSPCIDQVPASFAAGIATDAGGHARVLGAAADMGAYEGAGGSGTGSTSGSGSSGSSSGTTGTGATGASGSGTAGTTGSGTTGSTSGGSGPGTASSTAGGPVDPGSHGHRSCGVSAGLATLCLAYAALLAATARVS